MRLQTFRDDKHSRHLDLIGNGWSIDLVIVTAASIMVMGFACAIASLLVR